MADIKIFDPTVTPLNLYVSLVNECGSTYLAVVDGDGDVDVYLAEIKTDGISLCTAAKNKLINTDKSGYVVVKKE